jgi:hypothetical protein
MNGRVLQESSEAKCWGIGRRNLILTKSKKGKGNEKESVCNDFKECVRIKVREEALY